MAALAKGQITIVDLTDGTTGQDIQDFLSAGVGSVLAGLGGDYELTISDAAAGIVILHKDAAYPGPAAPSALVTRPGLAVTGAGIAMGYNDVDGIWKNAVLVKSDGDFAFGDTSGKQIMFDASEGHLIIGQDVKVSSTAGKTMAEISAGATGYDKDQLEFDVAAGVENLVAGFGANYKLVVDAVSGAAVFQHKDTVYDGNCGEYTGDYRTALGISSNGVAAGFNHKTTGAWTPAFSINASTGNAAFIGAITANAGSFVGNVTVGTNGSISKGKTSTSDTTSGFWLGTDGGSSTDFHIGNATNSLKWDGSAGTLTVKGTIDSTSYVGNILASDLNQWDSITGAGMPEDNATRNVFKGDWLTGITYVVGDIVVYQGSSWSCIEANISSGSILPPTLPTSYNTYWTLYGAVGAAGAAGTSTGIGTLYFKNTSATVAPVASISGDFTYTFATGLLSGGTPNGWSYTQPTATTGEYIWVRQTSCSGTTATVIKNASTFSSAVCISGIGTNGLNGLNSRTITLFRVSTNGVTAPSAFSGTFSYVFSTDSLTGGTLNSWTRTIPTVPQGSFLWIRQATASSTTDTDSIDTTEFSAAVVTSASGAAGAAGATGAAGAAAITAFLTNTSHTVPTDSAGANGVYTGCTTTMYIFEGATDISTVIWTYSAVATTGTVTFSPNNSRTLTVSNMTTDVATITITANRSGYSPVSSIFTISKVKSAASIASKLEAGTSYTLTGVVTPADTGALKVGGITWDSATGVLTGTGSGIAITEYGIIGAKGGVAQFTIDTSGTATFAGTLSAATGSFGTVTATHKITLAPGGYGKILAGTKTEYGDSNTGFYIGYPNELSVCKFDIGSSSAWMRWTGTEVDIKGGVNATYFTATGLAKFSGVDSSSYPFDTFTVRPTVYVEGTGIGVNPAHVRAGTYSRLAVDTGADMNIAVVGVADTNTNVTHNFGGYFFADHGTGGSNVGVAGIAKRTSGVTGTIWGVWGGTNHLSGIGVYASNTAGGTALICDGAFRINQTPVNNGTAVPTLANTKPGSNSASKWLSINLNGTVYYIPVWT
jgi:hypothetical protein